MGKLTNLKQAIKNFFNLIGKVLREMFSESGTLSWTRFASTNTLLMAWYIIIFHIPLLQTSTILAYFTAFLISAGFGLKFLQKIVEIYQAVHGKDNGNTE